MNRLSSKTNPQAESETFLARGRWNVLDLITFFGAGATPLYLFCDIDMTAVQEVMENHKRRGTPITVTSILIQAIGSAQSRHPDSQKIRLPWVRTYQMPHIAAGFTVEKEVETQPAVFLGVVDSPHQKSVLEISEELKRYAQRPIAETPQLALEQWFSNFPWLIRQSIFRCAQVFPSLRMRYLGATFGLTSLGKYGVHSLIGPCVCTVTFGVGCIEDRTVVASGQLTVKPMMTLSMVVDCQVISCEEAAAFMQEVRTILESFKCSS